MLYNENVLKHSKDSNYTLPIKSAYRHSKLINMVRPYFLILGLRIFFQNIKVGGKKN